MTEKIYLTIKDILKCTGGILVKGNENYECKNFVNDTRKIKKGDTYIAIKGENFDGNEFFDEALEKGADTVIIEKSEIVKNYDNKNIIVVKNTREALKQIALEKRNLYKDLIVIGVTGSVGKTSTKDMIYSVLKQKYNVLKTEGNFNNDIGLPLTILNLKNNDIAVIEMGMNHKGEISELTKIAKPQIAVITNIGTAHIGNLGSRENILNAKLEILESMETPKIIINNDNDLLNKWENNNKEDIEVHTFGIKNKSECYAEKIKTNENNSEFICNYNDEKINVNVPVGGEVFIYNSLCAILVGKLLNLSNSQIQNGVKNVELSKKRMELINLKNDILIINDSYNASLDSVKAAIKYLVQRSEKRKIAVLGDLFELGVYSEKIHREIGKYVAQNQIDLLYLIGDNSKYIKDEALKYGMSENNIFYFDSRSDLLNKMNCEIKKDDVILFKASNGMKLFEIVEKIKNSLM